MQCDVSVVNLSNQEDFDFFLFLRFYAQGLLRYTVEQSNHGER